MRPYIFSMHIQFVLYESNKRLYVTYSYTNESNKITTCQQSDSLVLAIALLRFCKLKIKLKPHYC